MQDNIKIVKTDINSKNGQDKCPKCGFTDISLNPNTGKLRCNFCRYEFVEEKVTGLEEDISKLEGKVIGSGSKNINNNDDNVITLKCESCGAEVVIDISSKTQSRCHWCRNILSINKQVPNGIIPDMVLPFKITKEEAEKQIKRFVRKRSFFSNHTFKKEFKVENIMGVYFPYMIVDINSHCNFKGLGEHSTDEKYTLTTTFSSNDNYYSADLYEVGRESDFIIEGLTVEANSDKLNNFSNEKTNNIINSIMPFDIENCIKYNSNYMKGYSSEKRDINIYDLKDIVKVQAKDIARFSCNKTLDFYNRGVCWKDEVLDIKGEQWKTAYLPVWLYSYQQVKKNKKILHYVAVNARTKETMGSIPINFPKLLIVSSIVEIIGFFMMIYIDFDYSFIFLALGIIYFIAMFSRYRNLDARHKYESETKIKMSNLKSTDNYIKHEIGLTDSKMSDANNTDITGKVLTNQDLNELFDFKTDVDIEKK